MGFLYFIASIMGFLDSDLRYPSVQHERNMHKKKRLVQGPNSFFMDVKCPACGKINVVYSHATTAVGCSNCAKALCKPTGGKAVLKALLVPPQAGPLSAISDASPVLFLSP